MQVLDIFVTLKQPLSVKTKWLFICAPCEDKLVSSKHEHRKSSNKAHFGLFTFWILGLIQTGLKIISGIFHLEIILPISYFLKLQHR